MAYGMQTQGKSPKKNQKPLPLGTVSNTGFQRHFLVYLLGFRLNP